MALGKMESNSLLGAVNEMKKEKPTVVEIKIDDLVPYHKHPFTLYEGERLDDMVESITEHGVLNPIIVQPCEGGKYEILAGHNRANASKLAGKTTIPAIVKEGLSETEAYIYVVETNVFQRGFENLKLSEQAVAVAERADAFREEKRKAIYEEIGIANESDKTPTRTDEALGVEYGMNSKRVARLIRLNKHLAPSLNPFLDNNSLPFIAAINLSFLPAKEQDSVAKAVREGDADFSLKSSESLKGYATNGRKLTYEDIVAVMNGQTLDNKTDEKAVSAPTKSVKVSKDFYDKFFPKGVAKEQITSLTELALTEYFENHPEALVQDDDDDADEAE